MRDLLFLLVILACPLMMVFMHGGHGLGGHGQVAGGARLVDPDQRAAEDLATMPTNVLLERRSELDREIRL